jgi:hypothetical protein
VNKQRDVTEWEIKVAQAVAYLDQFEGDETKATHLAAKNGELIDDSQWHAARMRRASPN